MSTKVTLSHNGDYHLYEECFEQDNVWLQIDNPADVELRAIPGGSSVTVAIPVATWRHLVEGWLNSHWAQHPELDNTRIEPDIEGTIAWLEELAGAENE